MNEKSNGNSYKALEDFEITISLKKIVSMNLLIYLQIRLHQVGTLKNLYFVELFNMVCEANEAAINISILVVMLP